MCARIRILIAVATLVVAAPPLAAQDPSKALCVACSGPEAVYRCEVASAEGKPVAPRALQLFCITRLAKDGGHQSCSAHRADQAACSGIVRRYPYDPSALDLGPKAEDAQSKQPETQQVVKPREPQTVVEAGERAVDASKQSLQSIGSTVKDGTEKTKSAARSTWRCLTSFFTAC